MKKLLLLIALLFLPSWAEATNYYVDPACTNAITTYEPVGMTCTGGSATVYDTIAHAQAAITGDQHDNSLLLKKGSTFREQFTVGANGTSGHPFTIGAFGTGAKPIISGADAITSWSADGITNVWNATVTTQPNLVMFNGSRGKAQASKAACTADGYWYWNANTLSVYATSTPSSYYTSVEAASRARSITNRKDYVTFDGLRIYGGNDTLVSGILLQDYDEDNSVAGCVIRNCVIGPTNMAGINVANHASATIIEHNEIYDNWNGLDYGSSGNGWGLWMTNGASGTIIRYNYIHDNFMGITDDSSKDTSIYYNLFANNKVDSINHTNGVSGHPCLVYNNSILHNPTAGTNWNAGHGIVGQLGGDFMDVRNNIVYCPFSGTATNVQCWSQNSANTTITDDYNLCYIPAGATCYTGKLDSTQYATMANWRTAIAGTSFVGKDAHSLNADPLFVSTSTPDFHLQSNSPAINAGVNVSLTSDYDGWQVPQGAAPDIGAYEWYPSLAGVLRPATIGGVAHGSVRSVGGVRYTNIAPVLSSPQITADGTHLQLTMDADPSASSSSVTLQSCSGGATTLGSPSVSGKNITFPITGGRTILQTESGCTWSGTVQDYLTNVSATASAVSVTNGSSQTPAGDWYYPNVDTGIPRTTQPTWTTGSTYTSQPKAGEYTGMGNLTVTKLSFKLTSTSGITACKVWLYSFSGGNHTPIAGGEITTGLVADWNDKTITSTAITGNTINYSVIAKCDANPASYYMDSGTLGQVENDYVAYADFPASPITTTTGSGEGQYAVRFYAQ